MLDGFNLRKVLLSVGFDTERAARGHKDSDGVPVAVTVHLETAEKPLVLVVCPHSSVERDPGNSGLKEGSRD